MKMQFSFELMFDLGQLVFIEEFITPERFQTSDHRFLFIIFSDKYFIHPFHIALDGRFRTVVLQRETLKSDDNSE